MKSDILDDKIFEQLNMNDLSQSEKENFSKTFFAILNTRVNAKLVAQMDQAQQDEYIKLIGEGDEAKITEFKQKLFPNLRSIVDEEAAKLILDINSGAETMGDEIADEAGNTAELSEPSNDPFLTMSSAPPPQPPPGVTSNT
ncbi:MAG: hypothetical protein QG675_699 [Patescibacteria group bacterium]|jgi:hypothetical protein|nr:hypothetical protein [Patescibacteria group bacterium]